LTQSPAPIIEGVTMNTNSRARSAPNAVSDSSDEAEFIPRILVVDDDDHHRRLMEILLRADGYLVDVAANGTDAHRCVTQQRPDLILLDIMLPDTDGYELTRKLKANHDTAAIPIIMITALSEREARLRGLEAGAEDFLIKPVDRTLLSVRVRNLLNVKNYHDLLRHHNRLLEREIDAKTQQVRQHCIETVLTLTRAAEYRDETTGNHVNRISHYTAALAERLGMDSVFRDQIFYASPMHDIGKLAIPDHILLKPAPLTPNEWEIMKTHTTLGREILNGNNSPYLAMGAEIAMYHHEFWDGSGYPTGRTGDMIPLPARIMGICDVYDALRSKRPYKKPHTHDEAIAAITRGDDRVRPEKFDPEVLNSFVSCQGEFAQIYAEFNPRASGH
jgi:putative two-component system response regulator